MANLVEFYVQGGPMLNPLAGMSLGMLVNVIQRGRFWSQVLRKQKRVAHDVLEAARSDLAKAAAIAQQGQNLPIGRFLSAPLKLQYPTPETFRLALEAAAEQEFVEMRKGNRTLELVVAVAPLFGLLGAAIAVLRVFGPNFSNAVDPSSQNFMQLVYQAMIPVAVSLNVEIIALTLLGIFKNLQGRQVEYFSEVGTKLELFYRELWQAKQRNEKLRLSNASKYSSTPPR